MGNYVTYETKSQFISNSYHDGKSIDTAKKVLGKHFKADEYMEPLFELMAYGYTITKWWKGYTLHMRVASKVLDKPLIIFMKDEDGWYDNIEVFHQDGWYYGCNKIEFVIGLIKMFDLDPLDFVCISDEDLKDCILDDLFDKAIEYAKSKLIK